MLRAAVEVGLGLTCRTSLRLPDAEPLTGTALPHLPRVACILRGKAEADCATGRLTTLTRDLIADDRTGS